MGLDVAARLSEVEFRQRRVVRTRARDQHVVDGCGQLVEKPREPFEVGGVKGRAHRVELARGALEALGIPAGEDQVGALGACSPGRSEPDAGAAADHDDGLPEEFRSARDGRCGGCSAHDSSDQQSKITFA
jgi:hypothetical protein